MFDVVKTNWKITPAAMHEYKIGDKQIVGNILMWIDKC